MGMRSKWQLVSHQLPPGVEPIQHAAGDDNFGVSGGAVLDEDIHVVLHPLGDLGLDAQRFQRPICHRYRP